MMVSYVGIHFSYIAMHILYKFIPYHTIPYHTSNSVALIEELMELREDTFDITKVADFIGEDAHTYIHII